MLGGSMRILSGLSVDGYGVLATDDINFLNRDVHVLANSERDKNNERNEFLFCPKICNIFYKMHIRPYSFETSNNTNVIPITLAELNYWNSRCIPSENSKKLYIVASNSCNTITRVPIENLIRVETPVLRVKQYRDDELVQLLNNTFKNGLKLKQSINR